MLTYAFGEARTTDGQRDRPMRSSVSGHQPGASTMYFVAYKPQDPDWLAKEAEIVITDEEDLFWLWKNELVYLYEDEIFFALERGCRVVLLKTLPDRLRQMIEKGEAVVLSGDP